MTTTRFELQPLQGGKIGLLAVFTAKTWEDAVKVCAGLGTYPAHSHETIKSNPNGLDYGVYLRKHENSDQFYYYISVEPLQLKYADFEKGEIPLFAELPEIKTLRGRLPIDEGRDLARKIRQKGATNE